MFVTDSHLQFSEYLHDYNFVLVDVKLIIKCVEVITDPVHGVELPGAPAPGVGADEGHQEAGHGPPVSRRHQAIQIHAWQQVSVIELMTTSVLATVGHCVG